MLRSGHDAGGAPSTTPDPPRAAVRAHTAGPPLRRPNRPAAGYHLSEEGNRLAAEAVFQLVTQAAALAP